MNNTNNIYNYLVDTLGAQGAKVEQLPNGGYYVSNWTGKDNWGSNELYIPPNFNSSNVTVVAHLPGSGGSRNDAKPIRETFMGENAPDHIVAISSHSSDNGQLLECVSEICNDNNLNITDLSLSTFSASGGQGFKTLETFLENNPDVNASMFVADGYSMNSSYFQNIDTIAKNDVPVVLVMPKGQTKRLESLAKNLAEQGVNIYFVESDRGEHVAINRDMLSNGMVEYSLGIIDEMSGENLEKCNYKLLKYDEETKKFVYVDSFDEIRHETAFGSEFKLLNMKENPYAEGTLGSDLYLVASSINAIRGTLGNTNYQSAVCTGTSSIPGQLSNAQNSLLGISSDLNNSLASETTVIASIAQTIHDMDVERANAAGALSDGSGLLSGTNLYGDLLSAITSMDLSLGYTTFQSFMFNPSSHVEGNSGKLCMSDINAMLSGGSLVGPLHENFESERASATKTKAELDNLSGLITSSNNFQGEIWNKVVDKLNQYSDNMELRIKSADLLENAMVKALTLIKDYMGDYEELDDSKLPELREKITQTKAQIAEAQTIINATKQVTHTYTDENGKVQSYTTTEYVYSASARQAAMRFIREATILLQELSKEVEKLEGLPIILAQAEQIVNDALSEIYASYGVSVSDIVVGHESSYIPPANTTYTGTLPKPNNDLGIDREIPEGKVSEAEFDQSLGLQHIYGTYNDYLNGVESKNNPMHNPAKEDTGIGADISDTPEVDDGQPDTPEENPDDGLTTEPNDEDPKGNNPNGNNPSDDKPSGDKPSGDTPSGDKPSTNTPSEDKPSTNTPSEDKPTTNTPSEDKPSTDTPSEDKPTTNSPSEDKPSTNTPSEDKPSTNTPSEDKPSTNSPSEDEPTTNTPSENKPSTNKPNQNSSSTSKPSGGNSYKPTPSVPDTGTNDNLIVDNETENIPEVDNSETIPPVVEIPDDEIVDITPDNVYENSTENSSSSNESSDLAKKIGIGLGVGAAVGAAALGAHTYSKAKKNNIYEDD